MSDLENQDKNIDYLYHYSTDFSKIFTKMFPMCLTALKLEIYELENLGQGQTLQRAPF